MGQRRQAPVALDELNDGGMVVVAVHNRAATSTRRHHNQGNAGTVAQEIERLKEPRIPVTAALVKGNEEGRLLKQLRVSPELVNDVLHHGLEEIELRACRMAVDKAVGFHIGDRRQSAVIEVVEEIDRVLD